jgi:hypothetical protein
MFHVEHSYPLSLNSLIAELSLGKAIAEDPAGTLGSASTRLEQSLRAGYLRLLGSVSLETERSTWNMFGPFKGYFMGYEAFHVEHKTHFAQKSEPLT